MSLTEVGSVVRRSTGSARARVVLLVVLAIALLTVVGGVAMLLPGWAPEARHDDPSLPDSCRTETQTMT